MQIVKSGDFTHDLFGKLTVLETDGGLYFVGKEVANVLGYEDTNRLTRRLDSDEFIHLSHSEAAPLFSGVEKVNSNGLILVSESGLYSSILGSQKDEAKVFKKWVTSEVLPSIRKNGIYAMPVTIENMLSNPDFAIELLQNLKQEREARIEAQNKVAILTHVNNLYVATEIAKEIGFKSAQQLNKELEKLGVQYKVNNTYVFTSKYSGLGYESIKQEVLDSGRVVYHRKFTQLGRELILSLFQK